MTIEKPGFVCSSDQRFIHTMIKLSVALLTTVIDENRCDQHDLTDER